MSAMRVHAVVAVVALASCDGSDLFTDEEWDTVRSLANLPDPPADHSNKYVGDPAVIALGKKFYFDPAFSGAATYVDTLDRPSGIARAPRGQDLGISCNTCHEVARAGVDHSSVTRVSIGAGVYDVNSQPSVNSAYQRLVYWNGRTDSLWAQIVGVAESDVSMAGDRLKVVWRIADAYRAEYTAAFPEWPLPALIDSVAAQQARLASDGTGTCKLEAGACPAWCTTLTVDAQTWCVPQFPLRGKPGTDGQIGVPDDSLPRRCQRGHATNLPAGTPEPFDDAFDCMTAANQAVVTQIYVNWAKAIAAYEYTLISRDSAFDRWVNAGPASDRIPPAAKRGAKLFVGKAACVDCHNTPLLSDGDFHNIGIPQQGPFVPSRADCPLGGWCDCASDDTRHPTNCLPDGAREGLRRLQANSFRRDSRYSDDEECKQHQDVHGDPSYAPTNPAECDGRVRAYSEASRRRESGALGELAARWRTPSLRDVALTAPYMHDGLFDSLAQVIAHYNGGGMAGDVAGAKDPRISPLALTPDEVDDLTAFLATLTGAPLAAELTDPPALPPPTKF